MKAIQRLHPWMIAAAVTLLLAACGGGGTSVTPPVDSAPTPGVYLLAGGLGGFGHLDAKGTEARFVQPGRLTVDSLGNIWVEDFTLSMVRSASYLGTYTGLRTIDAAGVLLRGPNYPKCAQCTTQPSATGLQRRISR